MILPSIDIQNGQAVQLIMGETLAVEAGDPVPIAQRFGQVGEIAVVDLDAALGVGDNRSVITPLLSGALCRVGGGIRDLETARYWLDAGAHRIVLGTAAQPELLSQLPRERVIAALDARDGEVVVQGWTRGTGETIAARMEALRPFVSEFLVTFVEQEGRMEGTHLEQVAALKEAAGECSLTIAGGITTVADIRALDALGVNAQIGMALYTGRLSLADAFTAPLVSDRKDGLWPTIVTEVSGQVLGLCYSNAQSVSASIETGRATYWSRKRGLWEKGVTSGNSQELVGMSMDCDRDTLRFVVRQRGKGFCHLDQTTCFGAHSGLTALMDRVEQRKSNAPKDSYTARLFREPKLLASKLREEAEELACAETEDEVIWEIADLLYFTMVSAAANGVSLEQVFQELERRARQVTRRGGNAKGEAQCRG